MTYLLRTLDGVGWTHTESFFVLAPNRKQTKRCNILSHSKKMALWGLQPEAINPICDMKQDAKVIFRQRAALPGRQHSSQHPTQPVRRPGRKVCPHRRQSMSATQVIIRLRPPTTVAYVNSERCNAGPGKECVLRRSHGTWHCRASGSEFTRSNGMRRRLSEARTQRH
jgi:hypothetical protein